MKKLLEFKNVNYFYQTKENEVNALSGVNFIVEDKSFTSLVGPSGCGKTTILSLTAGLLTPSSGEILLDDKPIEKNDNRIGYMFQRDHLFEWRTIWQNIILGLELQKMKKDEKKLSMAEELLKKYDLYSFKNKKPRQLSGGMRQRVALIRTLVLEPALLLLDEPFSALDFQTRLKVCDDVYDIIKSEQKTALLVTHDISEALSMSDKIIILSKRPASVKEEVNLAFPQETPLKKREDKDFGNYFEMIWRNLI
ncbi:MAG: ABC transporter ATP-binding protein [Clostridia bacterium]|jgi:NitT/TauT family transport system ATP-binding protein|nr:ABC transporter ATP-binding protein [Clostridia bacterium]